MIVDGGIFKSTDGGARWNKATTGLTAIDVRALAINRFDTATVYTGAADSVFKSVDSGASWTRLFTFQLSVSSVPGFFAPLFPTGARLLTRAG